ncbi:hydrolase [Streptomyces sp. KM273126]|uniref:chitinase n=1 Tax=Streptomyces sp. KM273126 TaxID=2545247 RepID=UPI001038DC00|nr:chitinase [Streptomyces sp. KM273126]MBA2808228.1 hydrolase [Streptomyces sp. KM273126]
MRSFLKPVAGLFCLVALACAGCSSGSGSGSGDGDNGGRSTAQAQPPKPSSTGPAGESTTGYAPYVSATTASGLDSAGSASAYNLAFVLADGSDCTPMWDGSKAIGDSAVKARITALTGSGATVRVSFGGAAGTELAQSCDSASELAEAYGEALDAAGAREADFDIEGDALKDSDSVDLRSKAIALLQKDRQDLSVSFTLPVMPSGLGDDGVALLESANDNSVQVSTVNIMTMNYGSSYDGDMGDYAEQSAEATHDQLADIFDLSDSAAWRGMALTSMIGQNDVDEETFTVDDGAQVREFAEEKGIGWVSMWAAFRDRQCGRDDSSSGAARNDCSGVEQEEGAFAEVLSG